jgi:hypothetical protein
VNCAVTLAEVPIAIALTGPVTLVIDGGSFVTVKLVPQLTEFPEGSATVMMTGVVPRPTSVPAAGLCVMKRDVPEQRSEATTEPVKLGTGATQFVPASAVTGGAQEAMTGGVVSTTLTIRVAVCVFPEGSVAVYVIVYAPGTFTFTLPDGVTATVPAQESFAVAPASEYDVWHSTVAGFGPLIVMTGFVVSTTFTVRVTATA